MRCVVIGFVCAILAMLIYGGASVAQAYAAARREGPAVLRHPAYLAGLAGDFIGWLLSVVALRWLPLFVVQSLLAASIAVTVILARPFLKIRTTIRDVLAIAGAALGLVLVSISAGPQSVAHPANWFELTLLIVTVATAAFCLASYRLNLPLLHALLAGIGFSLAALGARAENFTWPLSWQLFDTPGIWAIVIGGAIGVVMYARALEKGNVGSVTALMWVSEVLVPGIIGVALLNDLIRDGYLLAALSGVLICVAASVVLAYSPAQKAVA